ncbi:putative NADPH:quinone reductase [Helianthus debilis subsp. tardiflorus]
MEALVCRKLGDPTLAPDSSEHAPFTFSKSHPIPTLNSSTSVRVRIKSTCLMFATGLQTQGKYQEKYAPPFIPGSDYSGVVESVGPNVTKFKIGDRVCSFAYVGSFAQYIVAEETELYGVPDGCDLVAAAAIPVAYGTSHFALISRAKLKLGQVLLVLGAAGGVGVAAIQIGKICGATVIAVARYGVPDGCDLVAAAAIPVAYGTSHFALISRAKLKSGQVLLVLGAAGGVGVAAIQIGKICGATVIAVARGAEKVEFLKSEGVDHIVDISKEGVIESVKAFLKTRKLKGVDVLYDPVGGKLAKESLKVLSWGAQILVIGFTSGEVPVIPVNIALVKNWTVHGIYWGRYDANRRGVLEESSKDLLSWFAKGLINIHISRTYKPQEVHLAFADITDRKVVGKVMITFDDAKTITSSKL